MVVAARRGYPAHVDARARASSLLLATLTPLALSACGPESLRHSPMEGVAQAAEPSEPPPAAEPRIPPAEPDSLVDPPQVEAPPVLEPAPPAEPPLFVERGTALLTSCKSVAHIGDSTSTGMMSEAYVRDPSLRLDAQYARIGVQDSYLELFGGRSMVEHRKKNENGVMVAQRLRDAGYKGCWVIGLGTCDAANVAKDATVDRVERIERMMAVIGDEPVLWIDTITLVEEGYWSAANMQVWNDELAATLTRYPNARIYRWSHDMLDEWFVKDGIHYNSKGYTARAGMVADALAAAFPAE